MLNIILNKTNPARFYKILILTIIFVMFSFDITVSSRAKDPDNYNLIIINIDALRADHLGCYGYSRNTTPFIDSLAEEGVIFKQAMSNSSYTRESVAVLLSGLLPSHNQTFGWEVAPPVKNCWMGQIYKEAGYKTGFFSNTTELREPTFTTGFEEVEHLYREWGVSRVGSKLSTRAINFIKKCGNNKFMMYLHYLDPHGPYDPPKNRYLQFADKFFPNPLRIYDDIRLNCSKLTKEGFGPGESRFEDLVLRYDAEILDTDYAIKSLFEGLKYLGLIDKTIIVVTADHGEEFLEHGYVEHAWTLFNESIHVPLIIWAPAILKPNSYSELVSTVDILPTVLTLTDLSYDIEKEFDGESLFIKRQNNFYFRAPNKPYIAELLIQHRNLVRAVIRDGWKYIAVQRWLEPESRPYAILNQERLASEFRDGKRAELGILSPVIREELYNIREDFFEQKNISTAFTDKLNEFREILENYEVSCENPDGSKPQRENLPKENLSPGDIEKIKSLGYL